MGAGEFKQYDLQVLGFMGFQGCLPILLTRILSRRLFNH